MKRLRACISVVTATMFLVAPLAAQEIKLTLADQNSPTGWGPSHAMYPWIKQVEAAGKGRIKIEAYPSQTLIKGIDMWKGVSNGIADIGWCVQGYWPEQSVNRHSARGTRSSSRPSSSHCCAPGCAASTRPCVPSPGHTRSRRSRRSAT